MFPLFPSESRTPCVSSLVGVVWEWSQQIVIIDLRVCIQRREPECHRDETIRRQVYAVTLSGHSHKLAFHIMSSLHWALHNVYSDIALHAEHLYGVFQKMGSLQKRNQKLGSLRALIALSGRAPGLGTKLPCQQMPNKTLQELSRIQVSPLPPPALPSHAFSPSSVHQQTWLCLTLPLHQQLLLLLSESKIICCSATETGPLQDYSSQSDQTPCLHQLEDCKQACVVAVAA